MGPGGLFHFGHSPNAAAVLYGPPAAGKRTIARVIAELPLFHNHLVVDAVAAIFPFGAPEFVRLRE
ncbi:hypothetical protein RZN05_19400 [Sphingomonas sp. HF-S4]|uniref:ATPase AAA-type core domain-containing protein n=1 Tax=Sphingomonas agrestis TaxID=3080540 RepID=A0ABU3YDD1_9SPHN|nr:hypothetical protein [Sphingomonas sp. HF-S4]MDV3459172.1 hypothetical protein [Sphingomonas sp. HF-S4]